ncbi:hypothetical protein ACVV2G_10480 [Streptomyces ziwulingensis]
MSVATEVRAGLLNAHVPPLSDAVARCIQHTVDDLGPPTCERWHAVPP